MYMSLGLFRDHSASRGRPWDGGALAPYLRPRRWLGPRLEVSSATFGSPVRCPPGHRGVSAWPPPARGPQP